MLCVVKTRVMKLRVIEGPKALDQIAFCAFHSFLVEVNLVPRVFSGFLVRKSEDSGYEIEWKSKRILAT